MKYLVGFAVFILLAVLGSIVFSALDYDSQLDIIAWLVILGLGFVALIAIVAFGVFCFAAYKWITRSKWEGKTPRGNRRV